MRKIHRIKPYTRIFKQLAPIPENREMSVTNDNPSPSNTQVQAQHPPMNQIFESLRIPDAVKDLPKFDGNPRLLYEFLANVEEILGYLNNVDGTNYARIILRAIRNKIVGPANEVLNVYGTPLIWENIKGNLILHYSDKRNETSLIKDLHNLKQTTQSVQHFYSSIVEIQSSINNNILIHESNPSVIEAKRKLFADMCLNTFLSGLKEPLGSNIRSMRPGSMAEALSFCVQEQNIYYTKKPFSNIYSTPQQNIRYFPPNYQNYTPTQSYQPIVNNPNRFSQQFPRQPYPAVPPYQNNTTRYQNPVGNGQNPHFSVPNNTFGQNRQFNIPQKYTPNLNNNNNPFNPNFGQRQYRPQNLPPPEPMDVSSGFTHLRKPPSMQTQRTVNTFKPQEIHNIDTEDTPYPYTNLDEYYYYHQNDYVPQDDMNAQNNFDHNFIFGQNNQYDHNNKNEIDDNENFQVNASPNQPDI